MEELYKDLKMQTEACYLTIKEAQDRLQNIREKLCIHPEKYNTIGDYEWRPGSIYANSTICGICGKLIDLPNPY